MSEISNQVPDGTEDDADIRAGDQIKDRASGLGPDTVDEDTESGAGGIAPDQT